MSTHARPRASISVAHVTTIADSLKVLLLDQLQAIAGAGYSVAGVSASGKAVAALTDAGIRHVAAPFVRGSALTPLADLRTFGSLVRTFRRERFTIVHTHTAKADLYAAAAARAAGVPIVVSTLHGFYFHDLTPQRQRQFYVRLARLGMRFCDAVLSQNPEDVDTAIREQICPAPKIEVLGNGIDIGRFDRTRVARDRDRRRSEIGLGTGPVIGFVGRLVKEKGVFELFAAVRRLRARFPDCRLILIGMFDRAKQDTILPSAAAEYGIEDLCRFLGHRDDMPELYDLMDVCVLPSHREGFPRTPMEASAMNVPVIATNIRGCRTAVVDGETGLLVPLGNEEALATAIAKVLDDRELARRMGEAGRRHAVANFDQRRVFAKVLDTYDRLLAERDLT